MGERTGTKLKILMLAKILLEETDEDHPLTMREILAKLSACGIDAERKGIYRDLETLREFGLDVICEKGGAGAYYVGSREFELAEVKLLADAVAGAKFISEKKSAGLIRKLGKLTSRYDAGKLNRQVTLAGRVKTVNESVYYTVDTIQQALNAGVRISFRYFQWNVKKEQELRHGGSIYLVSPWALVWDDEYYYLVAYDEGKVKHFRVDKMLEVELTEEKREGREIFEKTDMASYAKGMFGMFSGTEEKVSLEAENRFAGILIDRFGSDVFLYPADKDHFRAVVKVSVSEQFFSWVFSLGEGIRITGPETVLEKVREMTARLKKQYLP